MVTAQDLCTQNLKYKSVAELEKSVGVVGQSISLAYESSFSFAVTERGALVVPEAAGTACWGKEGVQ